MKQPFIGPRLPERQCPKCGHWFDAVGLAAENLREEMPRPGDISVCIECGTALEFTDNFHLTVLTVETLAALDPETVRTIQGAQRAVRMLNERN